MKKMNKTEQILKEMFEENTGIHCMDSGGKSNRGWQIRQKNPDWINTPKIYMEYDEICRSTYKVLCEMLKFEPAEQAKLDYLLNEDENDEEYSISQFFPQSMNYGNTCNDDTDLDVDFQFYIDGNEQIPLIIIKVHNGCDLRGGYSSPKVFSFEYFEDLYEIFSENTYFKCDCGFSGYSDDNEHLYNDKSQGNYPIKIIKNKWVCPICNNSNNELF